MPRNKSFTLIELLVVIVIIGILAGVIMISTSSSISKANFAKAKAFSANIKDSMFLDLVAEWTFDDILGVEGSTLANGALVSDEQGISDGFVYGSNKIYLKGGGDCVFRKCVYMTGSGGAIIIPNNYQIEPIFGSENFTLEMWVKPEDWNSYKGLINKRQSNYYSASPGGLFADTSGFRLVIGTGAESASVAIVTNKPSLNEWHHVVGTVGVIDNLTKMRLYIDGSLVDKKDLSLDPPTNTENLCIGGFYQGLRSFKGYMDEVKIYNSLLAQSQIQNNYIAGLKELLAKGTISKKQYDQKIEKLGSVL